MAALPWVTQADITSMKTALAGIIAGWANTLLWLRHIDSETPGATAASDWDSIRQQVVTNSGPSFGRGWQYNGRGGYLLPIPLVGGIWNDSTFETMQPEGLVLYSGAVLVYQAPAGMNVSKYDVIVDPSDTLISPQGQRYAVGDELANVEAFGVSVYRYAALEARNITDPIYNVPLS